MGIAFGVASPLPLGRGRGEGTSIIVGVRFIEPVRGEIELSNFRLTLQGWLSGLSGCNQKI